MAKGTPNGKPHAQFGAHRRRDGAMEVSPIAVTARTHSGAASQAKAESKRAPTVGRRRLDAALREIEALRTQAALLMWQVVVLAQEAVWARRSAHHDVLTGLPNRGLLLDRYQRAVALAARQHRQVALLFLDLDGFKNINDTLGHSAGDSILQQVAARLVACIRISDTACRYGGDEFVILLPEYEGKDTAFAVIEKIRVHLAAPYVVDDTALTVTASIGIAIYPVDGLEYGDLIRASDRAMYCSKAGEAGSPGDPAAAPSTWRLGP